MISKLTFTSIRRHAKWWVLRLLLVMALVPWVGDTGLAQGPTFDSGSNGSDGALNLTTPGTYIFDPRTFNPPLDQDGDNVYHFTTITIASGVTVRLRGPELNMKSVFWLASGPVQIDGTIDLNGENGHQNLISPTNRRTSIPGAGGYPGGVGRLGNLLAQPGSGPGGGRVTSDGTAANAGHATVGSGLGGGPAYGNNFLLPLLGGSGGGGNSRDDPTGGGGAGGGALLMASSASISANGTILVNGGIGMGGLAGGGSGGAIHLLAPRISGTGTLNALGGRDSFGNFASKGRIRLAAFQQAFTGNVDPAPILASPYTVFLPINQPSVRVVSIAGANVPAVPTGSFTTPDVTINSSSAVTLNIEARNVPVGTVIKLHVFSENSADQIVDTTPLAGTFAQSTATASVTVPSGYSRMYVRATWTP